MFAASKLVAGAMTLIIGIPSVAAHNLADYAPSSSDANTQSASQPETNAAPAYVPTRVSAQDIPPQYYDPEIPSGQLTLGELFETIGTRLYTVKMQEDCFTDLVSTSDDYSLLFSDVSIVHPDALSVCILMKNGLIRGSSNMLRPNKLATAAEAATLLSRLSVSVRNPRDNEPWYERYMEAMRSLDPTFTLQPGDTVTGAQLRKTLCALKRTTPQLDPMGEFRSC